MCVDKSELYCWNSVNASVSTMHVYKLLVVSRVDIKLYIMIYDQYPNVFNLNLLDLYVVCIE